MIVALILAVWVIGIPVAALAVCALCHWREGRRAAVPSESASISTLVADPNRAGRRGRECEVRRRAVPVATWSHQP